MTVYYILLLVATFYFLSVFILVSRSKNRFKSEILGFIFQMLIQLVSYLLGCIFDGPFLRRFFIDTYFASIVWFLFFYSYFLQKLTNYINPLFSIRKRKAFKNVQTQKILAALLALIDSIYVYSDLFFKHLYEPLNMPAVFNFFEYVKPQLLPAYTIHIVIYSIFIINISVMTIKKIFGLEKYYRKIYISLMLTVILLVYSNFAFLNDFFQLDLRPVFYIYMCASFTYYIYDKFPKDHRDFLVTEFSDEVDSAIACFDFERQCIYTNQKAEVIFGQEGNTDERIAQYLATSWIQDYVDNKSNVITGNDTFLIDGKERHFFVTYRKFHDKYNALIGSFLRLEDRTEEIEKIQKTKYRLTYDELTGLYNRHTFFEKCDELLQKEPDVPRFMIATNIKNFKLLNDLFGSKLGDSVLKKHTEMFSDKIYKDAIIGRISSDKFAMFIKDTDFNAQLLQSKIKEVEAITKSLNYKLKVYIGVYDLMLQDETAISMFDKALLAIKNIHGDYEQTLAYYDLTMMEGLLKEKNVLSEFPQALKNNELKMYLQPLTDKKGKCKCAEALVRWQHPLIGTLSPNYFLETIEKTGYIFSLDTYMWEVAAQKLKDWKDKGFEDFSISVNISPKDFLYADLYILFTDLVEKYGISPKQLKLEITETAFMTNYESVKEVVDSLNEYGFTITIDDFGSGYSSLNLLKKTNLDTIKLDVNFLDESANKERSLSIIKSIISMAKELKMDVIAKGVENKDQLNLLSKAGCKQFQGYNFARPMNVSDFESKYMGGMNND